MMKTKVLKYNQAYLDFFGGYTRNFNKPSIFEVFSNPFIYYAVLVLAFSLISSALFLYENMDEVKEALEAFKIFAGGFQSGIVALVMGFQIKRTAALHVKLQKVVDEVEFTEEHELYRMNELKCQKYTLRLALYVFFHTLEFTIVLFYALGCMAFGYYDPSSWYLSFKLVFPFDEYATISGWFTAWFIEFNIALCYSVCMTMITSYFVSCCLYIGAMCDHFNLLMKLIEHSIIRDPKSEEQPQKNRVMHLLIRAIKLHNQIFENSQLLKRISSGQIFALLPVNAIYMAVSMFDIEQTVGHFDVLVFVFDLSCIISALLWPFCYCSSANFATDKISSIGDAAFSSKWYDFPPILRKHIILVILRARDPVYFTGLGIVRCTLKVFGDLLRSSCSYYMLYRTIVTR